MITQTLSELLAVYQENPSEITIDLPTDLDILRDLLFEAITAVFNALQQSDTDKARLIVAFAETVANQTDEAEHYALSAWCYGFLYLNRNISESARYFDFVQRFYANTQQTKLEGIALISYASQLSQIGCLEAAEQAILRAKDCLDKSDYTDWPVLYLNLACVQFYQARYHEMLASAQQSEAMALKYTRLHVDKTETYKYWLAQAIINQALATLLLGKIEDSEQRLNDAIELASPYQWAEINGRARLNLARLYTFQGQLFAALEALKQAEKNFKSAHIDIDQSTVLLYQSDIYQRLMMPLQARSSAVQAAKILSQSSIVAESIEAYLLATQVSLNRREAKRARRYLEASEPLMAQASLFLQAIRQSYASHKILHPDKLSAFEALQQADQAYKQLHDLGAVAQTLTAALIAADLAIYLEQPDVIQRYEAVIEQCQIHNLTDLEQQARLQLGIYYADSLFYAEALPHLQCAAKILAFKRGQMPVEELKAALISGSTEVYTQLIEVALLNKDTNCAIETLIEAKGGIWFDLLSPAEIAPMPIEWTQARAELAYWQEEARKSIEAAHIKLCEARITHAQKKLTEITHTQQRKRVVQNLPTYSDIQGRLSPAQIILDYLVGSQKIWVCIISQKAVQWLDLGPKQEVERSMSQLNMLFKNLLYVPEIVNSVVETRQRIAQSQLTSIQGILSQLYAKLIEPIHSELEGESLISQLLVIPDSYLFELPWTALYDGRIYLGKQYNITLYPSSALLAFDEISHRGSSQNLGHPYILGYRGNPPLQHLDNSLEVIQNIWPDACRVNPAHTMDLKWEQVPQWLHIGAHGHVNRRTPLFSQLELADGPLLLADIFNLDLHGCELVTLSACETGTTPEQGGVLLALAGSFLCAGAKNVIASLWPVDDEATTILMGAFYKSYGTGISPQQALQSAQQELQRKGYEHPFYWAAFQVFARAK